MINVARKDIVKLIKDIELAKVQFKKEAESTTHGERYYSNLQAELICEDTSIEWSSEVTED